MEAEFPPAEFGQTWHHEVAPQLRSNLAEAGLDDNDDAIDAIRYAWEDHAAERDDSSVADLFASYDRCELLFRFSAERWLDDALVFSHRPGPETSELAITANLQFALNNLGYTIGEFRKASGNRHPATAPCRVKQGGGVRNHQPRAACRNHRQCLLNLLPLLPLRDRADPGADRARPQSTRDLREMLGGHDGPDQWHLLRRAGQWAGDREAGGWALPVRWASALVAGEHLLPAHALLPCRSDAGRA
jgi:hypothetical protein